MVYNLQDSGVTGKPISHQTIPRVWFGIHKPWFGIQNQSQSTPLVQFGYDLHMPNPTLGNVNIEYGLVAILANPIPIYFAER